MTVIVYFDIVEFSAFLQDGKLGAGIMGFRYNIVRTGRSGPQAYRTTTADNPCGVVDRFTGRTTGTGRGTYLFIAQRSVGNITVTG